MNKQLTPKEREEKKASELKRLVKEKKAEFDLRELAQKEKQLILKEQKFPDKKEEDSLNESGEIWHHKRAEKVIEHFFQESE